MPYSTRFEDALVYAAKVHADQVRKGTSVPYVTHLLAVAALVGELGGSADPVIAALLHDAPQHQGRSPPRTSGTLRRRWPTCMPAATRWRRRSRRGGRAGEIPIIWRWRGRRPGRLDGRQGAQREYVASRPAHAANRSSTASAARKTSTLWYYREITQALEHRRRRRHHGATPSGDRGNRCNSKVESQGSKPLKRPAVVRSSFVPGLWAAELKPPVCPPRISLAEPRCEAADVAEKFAKEAGPVRGYRHLRQGHRLGGKLRRAAGRRSAHHEVTAPAALIRWKPLKPWAAKRQARTRPCRIGSTQPSASSFRRTTTSEAILMSSCTAARAVA